MNSSMSRILNTAIPGRLARKDRFANQKFGQLRRIYYVQAFLGKESAMLYTGAEPIVPRSIRLIDGMDIPSAG